MSEAANQFDPERVAAEIVPIHGRQKGRGQPAAADVLLKAALDEYEVGMSTTGEPYAVPRNGPYIARRLRGGRHSLRAELAARYAKANLKAAPAQALTDVLLTLEGYAADKPETPLHLRVAADGDDVLVDLGDPSGATVRIRPGSWEIETERSSGPLFERTVLTHALPIPEPGGDIDELRDLLNVNERDWPLLLAWLVAALIPDIDHPIALLTGQQGTGKSTAARILASLVDPSGAPLRRMPKDEEAWAVAAGGSWVVCLDNLSNIPAWLSDSLCRAVTGDGDARRRLYSDGDLYVLSYRRVLILTSIDTGAIRGDLADRLLSVELEPISGKGRRPSREMAAAINKARPRIFGALLDLVASVLAVLPEARKSLTERPRMADFAEILAALDMVRGTQTLQQYADLSADLAASVVDADQVGAAVTELAARAGYWRGTASQLLDAISEITPLERRGKTWPKDGTRMSGRLRRVVPALAAVGVHVTFTQTGRARLIELHTSDTPPPDMLM